MSNKIDWFTQKGNILQWKCINDNLTKKIGILVEKNRKFRNENKSTVSFILWIFLVKIHKWNEWIAASSRGAPSCAFHFSSSLHLPMVFVVFPKDLRSKHIDFVWEYFDFLFFYFPTFNNSCTVKRGERKWQCLKGKASVWLKRNPLQQIQIYSQVSGVISNHFKLLT